MSLLGLLISILSLSGLVNSVDLPLEDVNIVALTDIHGWLQSQARHRRRFDADLGSVLSFVVRLKQYAASMDRDVFLVDNGDFCDGTGLSTVPPVHLTNLLRQMPYSALNVGNHELYHDKTVAYLNSSGFIDHWNGTFLSSNTVWAASGEPLGSRYTILEGHFSGVRVLTFGFLYNFANHCKTTVVESVQEAVQAPWFEQALTTEKYDAVLVMAHMGFQDPLVDLILEAIRAHVSDDMVVQFINGHTHQRGYDVLDEYAAAMEPGHFLDTVGYIAFNTATPFFRNVFLDASHAVLQQQLDGFSQLDTTVGLALSSSISAERESLGLNEVLGCSDTNYELGEPIRGETSLYGLYLTKVVPATFPDYNASKLVVFGTGLLRYNLFRGGVTKDDLISVAPYNDGLALVAQRLAGSSIIAAFGHPNIPLFDSPLPPFAMSTSTILTDKLYDVYTTDFDARRVSAILEATTGRNLTTTLLVGAPGKPQTTTQSMWAEFVSQEWPCEGRELNDTVPWFASVFLILAILGLFLFTYKMKEHVQKHASSPLKAVIQDERSLLRHQNVSAYVQYGSARGYRR